MCVYITLIQLDYEQSFRSEKVSNIKSRHSLSLITITIDEQNWRNWHNVVKLLLFIILTKPTFKLGMRYNNNNSLLKPYSIVNSVGPQINVCASYPSSHRQFQVLLSVRYLFAKPTWQQIEWTTLIINSADSFSQSTNVKVINYRNGTLICVDLQQYHSCSEPSCVVNLVIAKVLCEWLMNWKHSDVVYFTFPPYTSHRKKLRWFFSVIVRFENTRAQKRGWKCMWTCIKNEIKLNVKCLY